MLVNPLQELVHLRGLGYTSMLPGAGHIVDHVVLKDLWGTGDAQEFTDVSTEMFREFVLPYQVAVLKEFGLACHVLITGILSRMRVP